MRLYYTKNVYYFQCTYDTRGIPKGAGFKWNSTEKVWETSDFITAYKLKDYADDECKLHLEKIKSAKEEIFKKSTSMSTLKTVPAPNGLSYYDFQRAGIDFIDERYNSKETKGVLLADEMGCGKTIQTIGFINLHSFSKILIITPASLKLNWLREFKRWCIKDYSISILSPKHFEAANVMIINYELVTKYQKKLKDMKFDLMVCDEAHYLKNKKALRTKAVLGKDGLIKNTEFALFLTGTPILNRPKEIFTIAHATDKNTFSSFWEFAHRYCGAYYNGFGWSFDGASNLEELSKKLRTSIMIRRLRKDVLSELPAKIRQVVELELDNSAAGKEAKDATTKEQTLLKKQKALQKKLREELNAAKKTDNDELYTQKVKQLQRGLLATFGELQQQRHKVALAKMPFAIAFIKEVLDSEDKSLVLFAHHHDIIDRLKLEFPDAVIFTGRESAEEKQKAVDTFQNGEAKIFIGSIKAANLGITLTAASHVIFLELDQTPAPMSQAEDRLCRIGQENAVLVQHLVLNNSSDVVLAQDLIDKQNIIDKTLNAKKTESVFGDFLKGDSSNVN